MPAARSDRAAPREHWASRLGFVLAAVGSAVGLGNMWRFSYLTAENGGAAFVLLYMAFTLGIGLPVMLAEFAIGRGSGRSPIGALAHYGGARWTPLGWLFVAAGFLILSYYGVIAGWTFRYAVVGIVSGFPADPGAFFGEVESGWDAVGWHAAFMVVTIAIVSGGVKAGIERAAVVLMPLLFLMIVGLCVYAALLDSGEGYRFYLEPDFRKLLDWDILQAAAGQAFFSLSLGMGAMLTYASYLGADDHLPDESLVVAMCDFGVAFLAGLAVFPLIFALGLQGEVMESTGGTLFITLPGVFADMGGAGRVVGLVFFIALFVAALTSAISLLEVVVASAMDGLGWTRRRAAVGLGGVIAVLGIGAALWPTMLGRMDGLANNLLLPFGGFMLALFVGWVMRDPMAEVRQGAEGVRWFGLWLWLLRFPVPVVLFVVLVQSLRSMLGQG
jgi:NSS family neurotransmitter:Na+ symporter